MPDKFLYKPHVHQQYCRGAHEQYDVGGVADRAGLPDKGPRGPLLPDGGPRLDARADALAREPRGPSGAGYGAAADLAAYSGLRGTGRARLSTLHLVPGCLREAHHVDRPGPPDGRALGLGPVLLPRLALLALQDGHHLRLHLVPDRLLLWLHLLLLPHEPRQGHDLHRAVLQVRHADLVAEARPGAGARLEMRLHLLRPLRDAAPGLAGRV
mmetsp:Transcript_11880/g.34688  ORF Transcript_11880/g.34688 Transcript_11880/m.34688 type:complete len:212 (+) Transcript_11880:548-1183(+)